MISSSIPLCLILSIIVVCPLECRASYDYYYYEDIGCDLDVTLEKNAGSAFLHVHPIGEDCDDMVFQYQMQHCGDKSTLQKGIGYVKKEKINLCPRWKGCTSITIPDLGLSFEFTEDHGWPELKEEDISIKFTTETQRLNVDVPAYDRIAKVELDMCYSYCSCPKGLFPVFGNRSNEKWTFDLDGKGFQIGCDYAIMGSFWDKCGDRLPMPWMTISTLPLSSSSDTDKGAKSA